MVTWLEKRKSKEWAIKTYSTIFIAWFFLLVALITLVISPSNARYVDLDKNPSDPFLVPFLSLRYAFDFIFYSLLGLPLPHAILFIAFVGLGILSYTAGNAYDIRRSASIALLTVLVAYLLIVAIEAQTTYLYSAPPAPRGQSLARFVMLAGIGIVGWIIGAIVASKFGKVLAVLPAILLLACSVYTARASLSVYRELPGFMERAHLWDLRDAQIRESIAQGITQIEIIPIDTKDINTRDIIRSEAFGKWVTDACGVQYYEAEALRVAP